jgi:cytochrome c553
MTADQIKTRLRTLKLEASQLRAKLRRLEPKARKAKVRKQRTSEERERAEKYAAFREENTACWLCHRTENDRPYWWHGVFIIERMHIVNKPRVEDVRVIIAACSFCHAVQHGAYFPEVPGLDPLPMIELLRAKKYYDPDNYDPEFLQAHSVRRLEFPK